MPWAEIYPLSCFAGQLSVDSVLCLAMCLSLLTQMTTLCLLHLLGQSGRECCRQAWITGRIPVEHRVQGFVAGLAAPTSERLVGYCGILWAPKLHTYL